MKTIVIIPSRLNSSRLPQKALKVIDGKTVIWSCCLNAMKAIADKVYVASPNSEIISEIIGNRKLGGDAIITCEQPINGTERVGEAARLLRLNADDIVVNLQGDMPFFDPEIIDEPVRLMKANSSCNITSVMTTLLKKDYYNPNKVKVVVDNKIGRAVSFSRDYQRNAYLHIGVYVFRNSFLQRYCKHGAVIKEAASRLEQQRIMYMQEPIHMAYVNSNPTVIDTKEDLEKARNV